MSDPNADTNPASPATDVDDGVAEVASVQLSVGSPVDQSNVDLDDDEETAAELASPPNPAPGASPLANADASTPVDDDAVDAPDASPRAIAPQQADEEDVSEEAASPAGSEAEAAAMAQQNRSVPATAGGADAGSERSASPIAGLASPQQTTPTRPTPIRADHLATPQAAQQQGATTPQDRTTSPAQAQAPATPARPPQRAQPQTPQQSQQPQAPISTAPLPYVPSAILTAPAAGGGGDSSFWDLFSSSAPQAKLSRELVDWAPDLTVPPPATTLSQDWTKLQATLAEQDRATGHVPPYALRFGFVDELGEFHPMLDWGESANKKRENKHTARARDAAKDILSSIQHHRIGARPQRSGSIGQQVVMNGRVGQVPAPVPQQPISTLVNPPAPSPINAVTPTPQPGLTVSVPPTPSASAPPIIFSPPPSLPHSVNAATHNVFPRQDLPDTNWWLLTSGDGI